MAVDVAAVLRRVVADLAPDLDADWSLDPTAPGRRQVLLGSVEHGAALRIDGEWCDLALLPSGNGRTEFFDTEDELEEALRALAAIGVAYLDGRSDVARERGLIRTREVLTVFTDAGRHRFWRGLMGSRGWR